MSELPAQAEGTSSVQTVLNDSIRDIEIPARPLILERIQGEMLKDEPDFHRLANIISSDVSLSAGLMKTANSAYFGFRTRARTVSQALVLLGLDVVSRAVAGLILRHVFVSIPHMERFWDASARIARVSGWLSQELGARDGVRPEDAYTFGLFRDCGIPILLRKFTDYPKTLQRANTETKRCFTEIETESHPTHHAEVGYILAQSWWMPEETNQAIRLHHDVGALEAPQGLSRTSRRLICLSHLAEYIVQQATGQSYTREWGKMSEACLHVLGQEEDDLEGLLQRGVEVALDNGDV